MKKYVLTLAILALLATSAYTQRGDPEEFEDEEELNEPGEPGSRGAHTLEKDCPDGEFHDLKSDACLKCHPICKTCAGFKLNCLSCADGYSFDPLIKTHCLKDGFFQNKFHHLDELMHHFMPDNMKKLGIHHIIKPSGFLFYFLTIIFVFILAVFCYCGLYVYYKSKRGININEMYLSDLVDMITGTDKVITERRNQYQEM
jgi:hypothetical protein